MIGKATTESSFGATLETVRARSFRSSIRIGIPDQESFGTAEG